MGWASARIEINVVKLGLSSARSWATRRTKLALILGEMRWEAARRMPTSQRDVSRTRIVSARARVPCVCCTDIAPIQWRGLRIEQWFRWPPEGWTPTASSLVVPSGDVVRRFPTLRVHSALCRAGAQRLPPLAVHTRLMTLMTSQDALFTKIAKVALK